VEQDEYTIHLEEFVQREQERHTFHMLSQAIMRKATEKKTTNTK
jgi:hypothetical protein